ncbi:hypothetical protein ACFO0N_06830 [Halobium salinum]|uniref:DUF7344 domain-containing protein n=1 Tax=Halobium salinum TaxID=1364940 RepID=A0ABD5P9U4_9EURY|nr:hypothetical protein [Halobium salinum]
MSWVGTDVTDGESTGETDADRASESQSEIEESAELGKDDLFHVLQNQRRRRVLNFLRTTDGQVDMRDIAEQVAAWENGKEVAEISSDERQRTYIALYQSHLPKLDEMGIVEYDQSRGVVERTSLADSFDPYLDIDVAVGEDGDTEETPLEAETAPAADGTAYYGAATVVGLALTGATWAGFAPAALTGSLAIVVTAMFAVVTLGLVARNRQ